VVGPHDLVEAFADGAGRGWKTHFVETQYRLDAPPAPPAVPGEVRQYDAAHAALVARWLADFAEEAGTVTDDPEKAIERRLRSGGDLLLWQVDDEPVSMCGRSPFVNGVPRIGPVWTPPEQRRRGYAAAVTTAMCRSAFDAGAKACTLFADAANSTSNGVYLRLGFRRVGEIVEARFDDTPSR
jgi:predicted GNAT family acetyltransferase